MSNNADLPSDSQSSSTPAPVSPTSASNAPPSLSFDFAVAQSSPLSQGNPSVDVDATRQAQRAQQARRLVFLEDLVRNIDILVYAQLSALYYMDCSLIRLLLRLLPQWLFFTPKPIFLPVPSTARPYAMGLLTPFTICFLFHVFLPSPSAGEAVRGYLHGGLLIDFVGVQGPVNKWRLILGDIAVLCLQWVLLGLVTEVARVKESRTGGADARVAEEEDRTVQVEIEEIGTENQGAKEEPGWSGHPLDRFYGGQCVVAEVRIVEAIKKAWYWRDTPPP